VCVCLYLLTCIIVCHRSHHVRKLHAKATVAIRLRFRQGIWQLPLDCTASWWWGLHVSRNPWAMPGRVITPGRFNQVENGAVEIPDNRSPFSCIVSSLYVPYNYVSTVLPSVFIANLLPICVDATLSIITLSCQTSHLLVTGIVLSRRKCIS
jgi:hypothetical protein